jgi:hypothetical protein
MGIDLALSYPAKATEIYRVVNPQAIGLTAVYFLLPNSQRTKPAAHLLLSLAVTFRIKASHKKRKERTQ